jgi:hypothetical protein
VAISFFFKDQEEGGAPALPYDLCAAKTGLRLIAEDVLALSGEHGQREAAKHALERGARAKPLPAQRARLADQAAEAGASAARLASAPGAPPAPIDGLDMSDADAALPHTGRADDGVLVTHAVLPGRAANAAEAPQAAAVNELNSEWDETMDVGAPASASRASDASDEAYASDAADEAYASDAAEDDAYASDAAEDDADASDAASPATSAAVAAAVAAASDAVAASDAPAPAVAAAGLSASGARRQRAAQGQQNRNKKKAVLAEALKDNEPPLPEMATFCNRVLNEAGYLQTPLVADFAQRLRVQAVAADVLKPLTNANPFKVKLSAESYMLATARAVTGVVMQQGAFSSVEKMDLDMAILENGKTKNILASIKKLPAARTISGRSMPSIMAARRAVGASKRREGLRQYLAAESQRSMGFLTLRQVFELRRAEVQGGRPYPWFDAAAGNLAPPVAAAAQPAAKWFDAAAGNLAPPVAAAAQPAAKWIGACDADMVAPPVAAAPQPAAKWIGACDADLRAPPVAAASKWVGACDADLRAPSVAHAAKWLGACDVDMRAPSVAHAAKWLGACDVDMLAPPVAHAAKWLGACDADMLAPPVAHAGAQPSSASEAEASTMATHLD